MHTCGTVLSKQGPTETKEECPIPNRILLAFGNDRRPYIRENAGLLEMSQVNVRIVRDSDFEIAQNEGSGIRRLAYGLRN